MAAPEMYQDKDKVVIPIEAWKKIREALALPEDPEEAVAELLQTLPNTRKKNGNWRKLQGCLKGIASTKDLEEEHRWESEATYA
ncbi:MAG: hypothetical protein JRI45_11110 [Deltaproteobacteria bacterium]|nr:hypothetical protein [Deltaproteobacteria bacterium]MBW2069478.1 hypothetical protein [Deltaproteobacteria bacterium]